MYTLSVQALIDELGKLPGIGPKSAQRVAFHILKIDKAEALRLADSIRTARERSTWCRTCFNISDSDICSICSDTKRDRSVICVVEEPKDIIAIEKTREYKGLYHVLQGSLNPIDGVGPEQIRIKELIVRLGNEAVKEIILCTNPNLEGEATAMYISRLVSPSGIAVTRIASGLPVGGDLEYADELTLGRALEGRRPI
ncbi:MAG: recombination mediator RecR [Actinobacteria bacterium]|jgi:recombination protein RecR|nr:recombination mediator RecR [Actinomycetota bacterium]